MVRKSRKISFDLSILLYSDSNSKTTTTKNVLLKERNIFNLLNFNFKYHKVYLFSVYKNKYLMQNLRGTSAELNNVRRKYGARRRNMEQLPQVDYLYSTPK